MKKYRLDRSQPPQLTPEQAKRLDEAAIDYSDIPELGDAFFAQAAATWPPTKKQLTVRIDEDVIAWLRSMGKGYQTRINHILRVAMEHQKPETRKP